jgi:hypothetical protein
MLFDAQCWPGIVLAKLSAWFRAGMLSARRVGDAVGPASSWRCVRPSIEMATLSAQRRAGDAVGPASSCDGDGNAVGPASDDTVAAVLATLSARHRVGDAVGRWRHCASQSGISARSRAVGPASSVLASDDVIVLASLKRHHGPALSCQPGIVSRRRYGGTLARHHRDCVTTSLRQRQHRDAITAAASAAGDAVRVSLAYRPGVVLSAQHRFGLR